MAVARILTHSRHEADVLAAQLRARGYVVEIANPEIQERGPVELEITLESCEAQDALARATEMAAGDLDVFVARGALAGARAVRDDVPAIQPALTPARDVERRRQLRAAAAAGAAAIGRLLRRTGELVATAAASAGAVAHQTTSRLEAQRALWRQQRQLAALRRERQRAAKPKQAPSVARAARPKPRPQPDRLPVIRRTRSREREWRTAAIFSLGLVSAIMLGWAVANRRPAEPVPVSVLMRSNNMQQEVPFGPVTLPAPAATHALASDVMPVQTAKRGVNRGLGDEVIMRHFDAHAKPAAGRPPKNQYGGEVVVRHFAPAAADHAPRPEPAVKRTIVND